MGEQSPDIVPAKGNNGFLNLDEVLISVNLGTGIEISVFRPSVRETFSGTEPWVPDPEYVEEVSTTLAERSLKIICSIKNHIFLTCRRDWFTD